MHEHYLIISRQLGEVGKSRHHYPRFTKRGETKTGVIYALPKATQHVDGRDGISAKELLAHSPASGLCPLAPASPGVEIHLRVSSRGEKGRGGQDVQEILTVVSSSGVFFAPKGWAQRAQWCFSVLSGGRAGADARLEGRSFCKERLVSWFFADRPSVKNEFNSGSEQQVSANRAPPDRDG